MASLTVRCSASLRAQRSMTVSGAPLSRMRFSPSIRFRVAMNLVSDSKGMTSRRCVMTAEILGSKPRFLGRQPPAPLLSDRR